MKLQEGVLLGGEVLWVYLDAVGDFEKGIDVFLHIVYSDLLYIDVGVEGKNVGLVGRGGCL